LISFLAISELHIVHQPDFTELEFKQLSNTYCTLN
jgi:hypothetical protein